MGIQIMQVPGLAGLLDRLGGKVKLAKQELARNQARQTAIETQIAKLTALPPSSDTTTTPT